MMVRVGSNDQPVTAARETAALQVISDTARAVVRPGHPVVIGREATCDLVIDNKLVSRRHAEVSSSEEGWVLRDLGSRNGTFVNGQPAMYVAAVDGGEVRLGSASEGPVVRFAVIREAAAAGTAIAPPVVPEQHAPTVKMPTAPPPEAPMPAPTARVAGAPPGHAPRDVPAHAPPARVAGPPPGNVSGPPPGNVSAPPPGNVSAAPPAHFAAPPPAHVAGQPPAHVPAAPPATVGAPPHPTVGAPPHAATARVGAPPEHVPEHAATAKIAAAASVAPALAARTPTAEYVAAERIRIGRGPDSDIVLTDLRTSRNHAELRRAAEGYEVVDLGSRNGTFHNGRQVARALLRPGDLVSLGRHEFIFDGQRLHEFEDTGPVSLIADDLTVTVKNTQLIDDISFALPEGSLLAVIGPSGCGKSTLLRAVTGLRPATQGRVHYDGRDLYSDYAELRYRIGLVPQDDVLHRQLTVRRALRFAASLRFADDVPRKERNARVDEVLETLNLTERAKQRIDTLSGGQRKRVSVALELLTEPSLLFLDEPTSGLDPALDKEVMQELRELADRGRTVITVTHNVLHLDMCDRVLVMCTGGRMGYFGPPDQLLKFFEADDYAEVFGMITDNPDHWARKYRQSKLYQHYVTSQVTRGPAAKPAAAVSELPAPPPAGAPVVNAPVVNAPTRAVGRAKVKLGGGLGSRALHPSAPLRQFLTLCLRMVWVIGADRGYSLFLLGLPAALALLVQTVPGDNGLARAPFNLEAERLLVVLVVGAAFLGTAAAIREIVNESTIYKRERAVGLSAGAYLASKVVVFSLIICVQVAVFTWLSLLGKARPSEPLIFQKYPLIEIMVPVALVALASMTIGLLVSTLARTTEQTTPVLVVLVMAQLVFCGGLFELDGQVVMEQIAWLFPTRWGMAAGSSTVDMQSLIPQLKDSLWTHSAGAWWRSVIILCLQFAVLIAASRLALRRLEPGRE
jgi:ABC-type multidrug transport system ATPase subunit/pSer/pThr/pTyr-binding forkhead associated (FHA) protein